MLIPTPLKNLDNPTRFVPATLACALLLLLFLTRVAPHPAHAQGSGNWRTYTTADGLLSNNIQALAYREDPLDFPPCDRTQRDNCPVIPGLWVGTDKGLTYLNGRESILIPNLPNPDVRALLFDHQNRLWIATTGGLTWQDDKGTPLERNDDQWGKTYLAGRAVFTLAESGGALWAGTGAGVVKIDLVSGEELYTYLPNLHVTTLPRCSRQVGPQCDLRVDGQLWIGTDQGIYRLASDDKNALPEPGPAFPLTATLPISITALTRSNNGLWVGTNKGAAFWNGVIWETVFTSDSNLASPIDDQFFIVEHQISVDTDPVLYTREPPPLATLMPSMPPTPPRPPLPWTPLMPPTQEIVANVPSTPTTPLTVAAPIPVTDGLGLGVRPAAVYRNGVQWDTLFASPGYLASLDVRAIDLDAQDQVWFATAAGVQYWHLQNHTWQRLFQPYELIASNNVQTLLLDSRSTAWIGTIAGLSGHDRAWAILTDATTLTVNQVTSMAIDPTTHQIWIGTSNDGITILSADRQPIATLTEKSGLVSNQVTSIVIDSTTHQTWVGTEGGVTVLAADHRIIATLTKENGLGSNVVTAIAIDPITHRTWIGTDASVTIWDTERRTITNLIIKKRDRTTNSLQEVGVQSIAIDPTSSQTWLGTDGAGVIVLDSDLQIIVTLSYQNGLAGDHVANIAIDLTTSQTWVGYMYGITIFGTNNQPIADNKGITLLDDDHQPIITLTTQNGLVEDFVTSIAIDPTTHQTWLGTFNGVTVLDANHKPIATLTTENGLTGNYASSIVIDPTTHQIWVGTDNGITVLDADRQIIATVTNENGPVKRNVNSIAIDPANHQTWLATAGAVTVWDAQRQVIGILTTNDGLISNNVNSIAIDPTNHQIWLATAGSGAMVFADDRQPIATFTTKNGLITDTVTSIAIDSDTNQTWLATWGGGATILDADHQVVATLTTKNGLGSDYISSIAIDPITHQTWLGTYNVGITVLDANLQPVTILTTKNGLIANTVTTIAMNTFAHQTWIGTLGGGVTVLDADRQPIATLTEENTLSSDNVSSIAIDPTTHQTWIGTLGGGVTVLDANRQTIATLTEENGLTDNYVTKIAINPIKHQIWVGTQDGGVTIFEMARIHSPWLRLDASNVPALVAGRLADIQQLTINATGGSLLTNPAALGYRLLLTDTRQQTIFSKTFPIGSLGTVGAVQVTLGQDIPLAFHPYQLMLEGFGYNLQHYQLPAFTFTLQASPRLRLSKLGAIALGSPGSPSPLQLPTTSAFRSPLSPLLPSGSIQLLSTTQAAVSPLPTASLTATTFAANSPLSIAWQVDDDDADPNEHATLQYRWDYAGVDTNAGWQFTAVSDGQSIIPAPSIERGAGRVVHRLELRAIDADGNPSVIQLLPIPFQSPRSYTSLFMTGIGALIAAIGMFGSGLIMLARNSRLPFLLLFRQGPARWLSVGLNYRRYYAQWMGLPYLEQLLLLLLIPKHAIDPPQLQECLTNLQIPISASRLEAALAALTREYLLERRDDAHLYRATEPSLLVALQAHEGAPSRQQLAAQVRAEHPLVRFVCSKLVRNQGLSRDRSQYSRLTEVLTVYSCR